MSTRRDADVLEALGRALARTKLEVEQLGIRMDIYEPALGADRVRHAVNRIISNWSDVKEKLTAELEDMAGLLSGVACEYRALEMQIAAAMSELPPGAPDPANDP